jgi:hypothetical protein
LDSLESLYTAAFVSILKLLVLLIAVGFVVHVILKQKEALLWDYRRKTFDERLRTRRPIQLILQWYIVFLKQSVTLFPRYWLSLYFFTIGNILRLYNYSQLYSLMYVTIKSSWIVHHCVAYFWQKVAYKLQT